MPRTPQPQTDPQSTPLVHAPRLMLVGVAGIILATLGVPVPVLCSLALIGVGADADMARRAEVARRAANMPSSPWLGFVRGVHASMHVALFVTAWLALLDLSPHTTGRILLAADLGGSLLLLWRFRPAVNR